MIEAVKGVHPSTAIGAFQGCCSSRECIYRHRRFTALKELGQVEPYDRRAAPWKTARYEVCGENLMWGSDWTKLSVGGIRWYC